MKTGKRTVWTRNILAKSGIILAKNAEEMRKGNVLLENLEDGEFTTDFLCTKTNGDLMVRECVFRKKLSLPRTCKLLDASRKYWARRGITDWAIVVEEGESADEEE